MLEIDAGGCFFSLKGLLKHHLGSYTGRTCCVRIEIQNCQATLVLIMSIGKRINETTWIHVKSLSLLHAAAQDAIKVAMSISGLSSFDDFNVVKLTGQNQNVTLLNYPEFFNEAFPELRCYWTVDIDKGTATYRTYEDSINPPILHRKELLLPPNCTELPLYSKLTKDAESIGLFDDPRRIGFKIAWGELLNRKGYEVVDHDLVPIGNADTAADYDLVSELSGKIERHRTALMRTSLSAPLQTLLRFGFLDGKLSLFDYGCGHGDDIRTLVENNISAGGWDPYHRPDDPIKTADIVNLGFVINVIEDITERAQTLSNAYALADKLLVVSAMLENQNSVRGTPYADGVRTTRNTFQKYYSQDELRQFLVEILDEYPVPIGPGIFYVFKDKDAEQCFLYDRQTNRRNILRLSYLSRRNSDSRTKRADEKYETHKLLLESLWGSYLTLGRQPHITEFDGYHEIVDVFGSLPACLRFIKSRKQNADELLEAAKRSRTNDILVYLALLAFDKRKAYTQLEPKLQRDIKVFFGSYKAGLDAGRELLFSVADVESIERSCEWAAERGIGHLTPGESLQLHSDMVVELPPLLRVYIGCGAHLYGDISNADLLKVHVRSGKLTLLNFDDFESCALPRMVRRVKVDFREQELMMFEYGGDFAQPYLFQKSRYINEEYPNYNEQAAFDKELEELQLFDFSNYGPTPTEFNATLALHRYEVNGFKLSRSRVIPSIDVPCGRYFTYRDLIECGETQRRTQIANTPIQPETYTALHDLATNILDPVIDYFGMIRLTYGFCSSELAKHVPSGIAPSLDQHAAFELNRNKKYICQRLGAAVDFLVEDENMEEVALWVFENTPVDRIYYYGDMLPIHVSYGPDFAGMFIIMKVSNTGRLIPHTLFQRGSRQLRSPTSERS